ncbi:hypothetical protein ACMG4P_03940 [Pseudovibrio denitrificans]|uniref:hypothetical protein n=1 Tax=Pseudovibrio denitrificans TaxID=258256 RepID=UPI0039BFC38D
MRKVMSAAISVPQVWPSNQRSIMHPKLKLAAALVLSGVALAACQSPNQKLIHENIKSGKYPLTYTKKVGKYTLSYGKPDKTQNWQFLLSITPTTNPFRDQKVLETIFETVTPMCNSLLPNADPNRFGILSKKPLVDERTQTAKILLSCKTR